MPVGIAYHTVLEGIESLPFLQVAFRIAPWLIVIGLLKIFFGGSRNTAERDMHSKVVMMTGATTGIGAAVAQDLAQRGAQLVLLTRQPLSDPFLSEYIMDMRTSTNNQLITAEQVELSSLHSIRTFATRWIDNAPPRRLDMIILCADAQTMPGAPLDVSEDGVENVFAVNYLANFHLLSILSPAIRAQPPHREVRILVATCSSYISAPQDAFEHVSVPRPSSESSQRRKRIADKPGMSYSTSKLYLMAFAMAFQKHLDAYKRPDGAPNNSRIFMVDPGWSRTAGMRRYITRGSLIGLSIYLATLPVWWLVLKSSIQGAQTFFWAAMEQEFERGPGGRFLKECKVREISRTDIADERMQQKLWQTTEKAIEALEKDGAIRRANARRDEKRQETASKKKEDKTRAREAGSRRDKRAHANGTI